MGYLISNIKDYIQKKYGNCLILFEGNYNGIKTKFSSDIYKVEGTTIYKDAFPFAVAAYSELSKEEKEVFTLADFYKHAIIFAELDLAFPYYGVRKEFADVVWNSTRSFYHIPKTSIIKKRKFGMIEKLKDEMTKGRPVILNFRENAESRNYFVCGLKEVNINTLKGVRTVHFLMVYDLMDFTIKYIDIKSLPFNAVFLMKGAL